MILLNLIHSKFIVIVVSSDECCLELTTSDECSLSLCGLVEIHLFIFLYISYEICFVLNIFISEKRKK